MTAINAETKTLVLESLRIAVAMLNEVPDDRVNMNFVSGCAYTHAKPYAKVVSQFGGSNDALRADTYYLFASGSEDKYPEPLGAAGKEEFAQRAKVFAQKLDALEVTP